MRGQPAGPGGGRSPADPDRREADLHLAVRGGTNLALLNAIQHELFANGWVDRDWVASHTVGAEELERLVAGWPPERAAEVCGVDAGRIREAARILGRPSGCCPPSSRASTSPTRRPRPPARSTTSTCSGG